MATHSANRSGQLGPILLVASGIGVGAAVAQLGVTALLGAVALVGGYLMISRPFIGILLLVATLPIEDMAAYRRRLSGFVYKSSNVMEPLFDRARSSPPRIVFAEGRSAAMLRVLTEVTLAAVRLGLNDAEFREVITEIEGLQHRLLVLCLVLSDHRPDVSVLE